MSVEIKIFIDQLKEKQTVQTVFIAEGKNSGTDKNGKPYLSLLIKDKTGRMDARIWDNVEDAVRRFESGDVVRIKGHMQVFNGRRQFVIHKINKAEKDEFKMSDLVAEQDPKFEQWWNDLQKYAASIVSPVIKELVKRVLSDPEVAAKLKTYPAARSIHHAYTGGMLEHVVTISHVMDALAKIYPYMNRDLLLFGALFHDIGKLWELDMSEGIQYTRRGRLIGHMEIGCELVDRHLADIDGSTPEIRDILKHIILSHHGRYEYGSPKRPKFLEAYLVSQIDELDSKLNSMRTFMQDEARDAGDWSRYSDMFDRYFYLGVLKNKDLNFD